MWKWGQEYEDSMKQDMREEVMWVWEAFCEIYL